MNHVNISNDKIKEKIIRCQYENEQNQHGDGWKMLNLKRNKTARTLIGLWETGERSLNKNLNGAQ